MKEPQPNGLVGLRTIATRAALCVVALCGVATACGSDDDAAAAGTSVPGTSSTSPATSAAGAAQDDGAEVSEPAGAALPDQYGQRYCEVLAVSVFEERGSAEVWGTQGLNDCPQDAFETLDPEAIAADLGAGLAVLNGPRYWTLDRIVANGMAGSLEIRDFGGIEMRSIATVELREGMADRTPLTETSVARDTAFVFEEDTEVHELTAPDSSVYVMQSYSVEVDPSLTADSLSSLGQRLDLPEGWSFASRLLDEELVVEDIEGTATVIQDEFRNTYQLRARG